MPPPPPYNQSQRGASNPPQDHDSWAELQGERAQSRPAPASRPPAGFRQQDRPQGTFQRPGPPPGGYQQQGRPANRPQGGPQQPGPSQAGVSNCLYS